MKKIKIFELFAGIGSPRKALTNLGIDYESVGYSEIDSNAVKSYCAVHNDKEENNYGDISKIEKLPLGIDLLFHGSPCQDFSMAGTNGGGVEGSYTRSSLMWETVRLVEQSKPKIVIWENVKGVLSKKHIETFDKYLLKMEILGYKNSYKVLDARDFGVPQSRERIFCISILEGEEFNFENVEQKEMKGLKSFLNERENDYIITAPSMLKAIEEGKMYELDVENYKSYAPTITTKQARWNVGIIPVGNKWRVLSPIECWRLMGFSDKDFENASGVVGKTALYKQAGNSIVVDIVESLFKELFK